MHKYLHDFQWLLEAPHLITSQEPDWLKDGLPPLASETPPDLATPRALGPYFENLVAAVLSGDDKIHHLRRNIQVSEGGITKGEFDFLFDRNGRSHHVETTVKFYLGTGVRDRLENWIGPGCRDRLDLKLDKILNRQLQLSRTGPGQDVLRTLGYKTPVTHAFTRGYLFHPLENWRRGDFVVPEGINPAHLKGWWAPEKKMRDMLQRESFWIEPVKPFWLDIRTALRPDSVRTPAEMAARVQERLARTERPVLLAALEKTDGTWLERHRGFIVPDSWPMLR